MKKIKTRKHEYWQGNALQLLFSASKKLVVFESHCLERRLSEACGYLAFCQGSFSVTTCRGSQNSRSSAET